MKFIFRTIFFIALIVNCQFLSAQSLFKEGVVVLNSGDSLNGLIDYRGDYLMAKECRFKEDENSEMRVYNPYEVSVFWFKDSKYFISKDYNSERFFFEFLINGQMDVLFLRESGEGDYYLEKDSMPLVKLPYENGIRIKDDKPYSYQSTIHNGILKLYTQDQPQLEEKINSIKGPSDKNLISIAQDYHKLVCDNDDCIVYEKKSTRLKLGLELIGSYTIFESKNYDIFKNNFVSKDPLMQYGIILHFWMPKTSEKIFLRTGYTIMYVNNNEVEGFVRKVPLMLEYQYPKYRIRPHFAYGLNFYRPSGVTTGLNAGFNVVLTENIYFSLNYDLEFYSIDVFPLAPQEIYANSFGGGLYFKF